jgi:hypothetical protein
VKDKNILIHLVAVLFIVMTLLSPVASAQQPANNGGYWLAYTGDNKLNKFIGIHSELQGRNFGVARAVETVLVRVGLNVYLKPDAMFTAGYAYFYNYPNSEEILASRLSENRIWQQFVLRQKSRALFIDHRYRLEQRFIQNLSNQTSRIDHRIRYRFQILFPLYTLTPRLRNVFLSLNNEIMLNFRKNTAELFDRNRLALGLGYQFHPKLNFQVGYMNQFAQSSFSTIGRSEHIMTIGVSYNLLMNFASRENNTAESLEKRIRKDKKP